MSVVSTISRMPEYRAFRKILTAAMKFSGAASAVHVSSLTRLPGVGSSEAWFSLILPYSCRTPFGLPVLPEV